MHRLVFLIKVKKGESTQLVLVMSKIAKNLSLTYRSLFPSILIAMILPYVYLEVAVPLCFLSQNTVFLPSNFYYVDYMALRDLSAQLAVDLALLDPLDYEMFPHHFDKYLMRP